MLAQLQEEGPPACHRSSKSRSISLMGWSRMALMASPLHSHSSSIAGFLGPAWQRLLTPTKTLPPALILLSIHPTCSGLTDETL